MENIITANNNYENNSIHMTKGFVTIATGKEAYFILAYNLLNSYRKFTKEPLPFAIITDKEKMRPKA